MASYNEVILMGNVGKDPVINETPRSIVARFSVATSFGEGDKKRTEWHSCEAWGQPADVIKKFVKKGTSMMVNGRLQYETFTDKEGVERNVTKIIVGRVVLLGGRDQQTQAAPQVQTQAAIPVRVNLSAPMDLNPEAGDLPFETN